MTYIYHSAISREKKDVGKEKRSSVTDIKSQNQSKKNNKIHFV